MYIHAYIVNVYVFGESPVDDDDDDDVLALYGGATCRYLKGRPLLLRPGRLDISRIRSALRTCWNPSLGVERDTAVDDRNPA